MSAIDEKALEAAARAVWATGDKRYEDGGERAWDSEAARGHHDYPRLVARNAITAYLSATKDAQAERVRVLEEALTPSAATKRAYIGEIKDSVKLFDRDGDETFHEHTVSWTAIKAVMEMIRARATGSPT